MRFTRYTYRIYPTKKQEILLNKTFGCCRYVYNRALTEKSAAYKKNKKNISIYQLMKEITNWKKQKETQWLKEVNSQSLITSLLNLDKTFTNFFHNKSNYPKFKTKKNYQSFTNPQLTFIDFDISKIYIPKFSKRKKNGIKCVFDRKFEGKIKSSTIIKVPSGKYFISILSEENIENPIPPKPLESKTLGIDLGLINYATFSNGQKIENPRHLKKKLKQLKRQHQKLSKKKKGSKNREKQRIKLAKIYEKVTNCRNDFLHKLTHQIVENQDFTSIAIEDLDVKNMLDEHSKNKSLTKRQKRNICRNIRDASWGTFRKILKYKCERYGKNLLTIGRFEPSSKLCNCGYLNNSLQLKDRIWKCPNCCQENDRDILASQNIKRFAFCKQNTSKNLIPLERRDFKSVEIGVS